MFQADLVQIDGKRLAVTDEDGKKIALHNESEAMAVTEDIAKQQLTVESVRSSERKRRPAAPFTTSSLQQDAARKLGFTSRKTMMLAQQLYEGIELGRHGATGLITYMRTDSTRISELAQDEAKSFLLEAFGEAYVPEKPNVYVTGKKAQDAHEALRPTSRGHTP